MQDHTITISAKSLQERNMRVRDLLSRGYMPIKFITKEKEYTGVTEQRYVDKHGRQQRIKATEYDCRYCVVLRKKGSNVLSV
ncbi:hypothetical protein SporoP37_00315 [Sporosarcina sp. P37]|uniref:hypothetical protein n=1 Tax=unclassified Sporosarcina TaxID=2647733 RepID=UPI000A17F946|nr:MULTISPECIES: hypothetical protein [unclassified Sporosarcina]ARK23284.1 hypothetical protein SporoP37_00315 [Sporosarcina sp. P37]PID19535.1 hypothetical protein CSV62_03265 [Sporosarcina sp. P35]